MSQIIKTKKSYIQAKDEVTTREITAMFDDLTAELNETAAQLQAVDSSLQAQITAESSTRIAAVSNLQNQINAESSTRIANVSNLQNQINAESSTRVADVLNLQNQINAETSTRVANVSSLQEQINAETTTRVAAISNLQTQINNETFQRELSENTLRGDIDTALNNEKSARTQDISSLEQSILNAMSVEKLFQDAENERLRQLFNTESENQSGTFVTLSAKLDNEIAARKNDTQSLNNKISTETQNRINEDSSLREEFNALRNEFENWKIDVSKLAKPAASVTQFDYDGTQKTLLIVNFDSNYMTQSGTLSATNAGNYSVTYSLKNKNVTSWSDGTTADVVINWTIKNQTLTAAQSTGFAQGTALTYNGNYQSPTISNFDSNLHTMSGDTSKIDAGTYTVYISPKGAYVWNDGTKTAKSVTWKINPLAVSTPTADVTAFIYDGSAKTLQVKNYDPATMTQEGTTSATDTGNYSVKYTLKSKSNYQWSGGGTADVTINWTIGSNSIPKPTASTTEFTYDGNAKTLSVANFDSNYISQTGTITATNAGDYSATFSLKNPDRIKWADNSTADVTINWTISRCRLTAEQSTFAQVGTLIYNGEKQSPTIQGYDATCHNVSGHFTGTDVGTYTIYITPKSNYMFYDGTRTDRIVKWKIEQAPSTRPYASTSEFTYDGNEKTVVIQNYDSSRMTLSGTYSATEHGDYTAYVSLSDSTATWDDGGNDPVVINWKINRFTLSVNATDVKQINVPTYDRNEHTVEIANFDSRYMVKRIESGYRDTAKIAGTHQFYVDLKNDNYCWKDGTTTTRIIIWHIAKRYIEIPQIVSGTGEFTYDGNSHYPTFTNNQYGISDAPDIYFMIRLPSNTQTDAGEYTETFYLNFRDGDDEMSVCWSDETKTDKSVTWKINPCELPPVSPYHDYTEAGQGFHGYAPTIYTPNIDWSGDFWTPTLYSALIDLMESDLKILPTEEDALYGGTGDSRVMRWPRRDATWVLKDKNNYYWKGKAVGEDLKLYWVLEFLEKDVQAWFDAGNANSNDVITFKSLKNDNEELKASVLDLQRAILDLYSMTTVYKE